MFIYSNKHFDHYGDRRFGIFGPSYQDWDYFSPERRIDKPKPSTEMSGWLNQIPFQVFLTVRPYRNSVKNIEKVFMRAAEEFHRGPLSYVVAHEFMHSHYLIASSVKLDIPWMAAFLQNHGVKFDMQRYSIRQDALPYILKTLNDKEVGAVDLINMDLFLKPPKNRKDRKRLARHQERLAR
jgi:hypothetical protein